MIGWLIPFCSLAQLIISAKCAIDWVGGDDNGCECLVPERQKGGFINRSQNKDTKQQQMLQLQQQWEG